MSRVTYDAGAYTLTVDDTDVARKLGALKSKTRAVLKVAINRTARQARKDEIAEATNRYALTARGKEKLKHLTMRKKATNNNLTAELRQDDKGLPLDLSYFQHSPQEAIMGWAARRGPKHFKARVLRGSSMHDLTAGDGKSKGFLVRIANPRAGNTHLAMVQRQIGSESSATQTRRGLPRWKNPAGKVEKLPTMSRVGASGMGRAVWEQGVDQRTAQNLEAFVEQRISQVIDKAKAREGKA